MPPNRREKPQAGSLSISSDVVTVLVTGGITILVSTGVMAIASDALVIISSDFVLASVGIVLIEGQSVSLLTNYIRGPPAAQLSFGSDVLRVGINYFISPDTGNLTLEGLQIVGSETIVLPATGSLTISSSSTVRRLNHICKPAMTPEEAQQMMQQAQGQ